MQPENRLIRFSRRACILLCTSGVAVMQAEERTVQLEAVTVAADRLPSRGEDVPFSITRIDSEELRSAPQLRLDDLLRDAAPGFSLFRRSSSRVAHPTTQGVSLRNIGPNGAGRTLVLLDGIPLNDPFAGWVAWNRVPPASLGEIMVNPGGGAGLFGNAALAGTIYLKSPEASGNSGRLIGTIGNRDTYEASFETHLESGPLGFSGFVNRFSTGGYPVLQGDQRGPVDTDADVESWVWRAGVAWNLDEHSQISIRVSSFEEERGNGTRLTNNASDGQDFSATWARQFPELDGELRLQAYVQRREFRSLFSSVNAERTEETLVLDQYDVPSNAAGGSVVWSQQLSDAHRIVGGADFRWIEGETNEAFLRIDDAFTRSRHAGGRQLFVGGFLEENWKVTDAVKVVAGGRLDYWRQFDGSRLECDRVTGETLRALEFDIGAINSRPQLEKIRTLVDAGVAEGGELIQPRCALPAKGYWFPPSVITGVTASHRIAQEEIFGPVLSVLTFRTPDEAVERANNTPYGLSAGVWTDKGSKIFKIISKLRAGVVWANTYNKFDPASPFGGYKESGFGREGGMQGLAPYVTF